MGFFCYNCGREVKRNCSTCPGCGVRFKAVKCPSCGYTDQADFFKGGCPRCGYMSEDSNDKKKGGKAGGVKKHREHRPVLGFIPISLFWFGGALLFLVLLVLIYNLISY